MNGTMRERGKQLQHGAGVQLLIWPKSGALSTLFFNTDFNFLFITTAYYREKKKKKKKREKKKKESILVKSSILYNIIKQKEDRNMKTVQD